MGGSCSPSRERDEWYMRPALVEAAGEALGRTGRDSASGEKANRTTNAARCDTAPRPRTRGEVDLAGRRERWSGTLELEG
jgi:hypothetical protein